MAVRLVLLAVLIGLASLITAQEIMTCTFCELITEGLSKEDNIAGALHGMFKRCGRLGLVEPVCDQYVSEYAKRIFMLARSGVPNAAICDELSKCGKRR